MDTLLQQNKIKVLWQINNFVSILVLMDTLLQRDDIKMENNYLIKFQSLF